ncbi:metal ABC transporter solute-binding protein, Zn/Mn family [Frondihabitans australicus]|uniref:Zinc/manganese transport system substrate-binding protein n=1 Tax=Frondihabitans australicus TaxID=386892 RepID=A0A495IJ80_9MICO|nr:zinc ABC transporter substrate-binding protein [Frondihabitans australicus]RKR76044.1 zinc/manganese transport system substrate-binding protein [Frondihabitans australicus]
MKNPRLVLPALALVAMSTVALAGCSSSSSAASTSSDGKVRVVASTDVYGDIAKQIGGSAVSVTSILTNPNQDPHTFEADAQTQLAISKAQVIIENGGGYDDFVDTMRKSTSSTAELINAVTISGKKAVDGDLNEHVFYDYPTMVKVADRMAADFAKEAPKKKAVFTKNAAAFETKMAKLESETAAIKKQYAGEKVSYTEPVPGYLFEAMGLVNVTPEAFSHAVEEGNDVPPAALNDELKLIQNKTVKMLAFNEQASSPEASQAQAAAKKAGVAVVPVTETLPAGTTYETWQQNNIDHMKAALAK